MTAEREEGLVVASYGRRGVLTSADGKQLRYLLKGHKLRPVCGDWVNWEAVPNANSALVTAVLPRENALERPDSRGRPETIAANLSCIAVVVAPAPKPEFFITDRYLCAAELLGATAVVVWNKSELDGEPPAELENYRQIGYPVLPCSAKTGAGIAELAAAVGNGVAVLVGQSGVGKSSLINRLVPDAATTVGELSAANQEGKHTTTASYMHQLPGGGQLIDSPGVRDFTPSIRELADVQNGFREVRELANNCRFANCQHLREPDCAVKEGLATGAINERRYASYKRLCNSTAQLKKP